ncbi:hypothetical protein NL529_29925, partial [Klebsiella pneumoniae]|nr:hypothetical protein [Klebsiella pneumoniae]
HDDKSLANYDRDDSDCPEERSAFESDCTQHARSRRVFRSLQIREELDMALIVTGVLSIGISGFIVD